MQRGASVPQYRAEMAEKEITMVRVGTLALLKKKSSSLSQPCALLPFVEEAPLGTGFAPPAVAYRDFGTFGAQARCPFLSAPDFFCSSPRLSHACRTWSPRTSLLGTSQVMRCDEGRLDRIELNFQQGCCMIR